MSWINKKGIKCHDCETCVFYPYNCPPELREKGCIEINLKDNKNGEQK